MGSSFLHTQLRELGDQNASELLSLYHISVVAVPSSPLHLLPLQKKKKNNLLQHEEEIQAHQGDYLLNLCR